MSVGYLLALVGVAALAELALGLVFVVVASVYLGVRAKYAIEEAAAMREVQARHEVETARALTEIADSRVERDPPLGRAWRP